MRGRKWEGGQMLQSVGGFGIILAALIIAMFFGSVAYEIWTYAWRRRHRRLAEACPGADRIRLCVAHSSDMSEEEWLNILVHLAKRCAPCQAVAAKSRPRGLDSARLVVE